MYVIYDRKNRVETIYHNPTGEQVAEPGMHIAGEVPQPDNILGLRPVLKIDVEKARLYYDYERPDTLESKLLELMKENVEIKYALAELAEAQEKDNTNSQLALTELAEMSPEGPEGGEK